MLLHELEDVGKDSVDVEDDDDGVLGDVILVSGVIVCKGLGEAMQLQDSWQ